MDDPERQAGPAGRSAVVPDWVQGATNLFAMLVTAVLVGIALFLIGWSSPVLAPLGLGLFLAALAAPLFGVLVDRGLSAPLALGITIGLVVLIGGAVVVLGLVSARSLTDSLDTYAGEIRARYADGSTASAPTMIRDLVSPDVLVQILRSVIDIVVSVGSSLAFATVIAALLLLDRDRLSTLVAGGLGSGNPMFREIPSIARAAVTYMLTRVRINAFTALTLLVLMVIVGVDDALLWAVGAFLLELRAVHRPRGRPGATDHPGVRGVGAACGGRHRDRRGGAERRRGERPGTDAHRPRAVPHDVARVHDVLLLGLADGSRRSAAVDAHHGADRARPEPQRAHPVGRRAPLPEPAHRDERRWDRRRTTSSRRSSAPREAGQIAGSS